MNRGGSAGVGKRIPTVERETAADWGKGGRRKVINKRHDSQRCGVSFEGGQK